MSTKGEQRAVAAFFESHQQMLSCVTPAILLGGRSVRRLPFAFLSGSQPVPLSGPRKLSLSVLIGYNSVEQQGIRGVHTEVQVTDYSFNIHMADGRELLAYQWHPTGHSWMKEPHLHIGGAILGVDLSKAHFPTGHVPLKSVLQFLIIELDVEPRRSDWRAILNVTQTPQTTN